tara:strand:+ start:429 stop:893 length:465 start_codon:yes stop_codon:yes gene_type:complete
MTAFDTAWALMKMPIVPNSLKEREGGFTGQFQDPITDEIMPLYLHHDPDSTSFVGSIPKKARTEAYGAGKRINNLGDYDFHWEAEDTSTDPNYRNRGYMTAIYDALAHVIDRYYGNHSDGAGRLYPNYVQTEDGERFWENKATKEGHWPVRDDL